MLNPTTAVVKILNVLNRLGEYSNY